MAGNVISIGASGLSAAQAGLVTTGHNISNANTPGYHRQNIEQSAALPMFSGAGFFGQGVKVDSVARAYNQFLDLQAAQTRSQSAFYSAYHTQLERIDNLLADPATGVSSALQDFFQALQGVSANPSSLSHRQSMLSSGDVLVSRFNAVAEQLVAHATGINTQITSMVEEINGYARQIAALNGRIQVAQNGTGQPPNDLYDQREELVSRLSDLISTSVLPQSDGTLSVFIGNGQSLVMGAQPQPLVAAASFDDPLRLEVGYLSSGGTVLLGSSSLQGGKLGGLLAFRANDLDGVQNALGAVALGMAQTFNQQQQLGQDLNGAIGAAFFSEPAPGVIARGANTGNAVVNAVASDATLVNASDYRLARSGASYVLTRLSDGVATTYAALPQTVNGITYSLASGAMADGDSFLIQPTRNAARDLAMSLADARGIAAAAPIRTGAAAANTGSASISAGTVNGPPPVNPNLQQPVTFTFTGAGTFDVSGTGTGNPTGVAYTPGGTISYNGWSVQIAGTPAAGDVFTISQNSGGVSDSRNALLLAALQTQNVLEGGTISYQSAYSRLVTGVGSMTQRIDVASQAHATMAEQALRAQQSVAGVNLDEEAANLLRYQQAYQASGKLIQVASALFETLLAMDR